MKAMNVVVYAAAYAAWVVTAALGAIDLWVWRSALLALFVHFRLDKWAFAAYSDVIVILLVLGWLVFLVVAEAWLRQSAERKALGRRLIRLDGPLVALLAIGYLVYRVVG